MAFDCMYEPDKAFIIQTINDLKAKRKVYIFSEKQYNTIKDIIESDEKLQQITIKELIEDGIYVLTPVRTRNRKPKS